MTVDTSKLRGSTKRLIGAVFAFGSFMQIPAVNAMVTPWLARHPKLGPALATVAGIYALLHNPQVQDALGIKRTVTVKEEEVVLDPKAEAKHGD